MDAPRVRVAAIALHEHPVVLRMPFRFGIITLHACPQAVVRVRVEAPDGRSAVGLAAEMLAPKWFDKDPTKTHAHNLDDLRTAVHLAREAYLDDAAPATAFGHFARHHDAHLAACAARGLNPLLASYGPALLDRAVLDATCRLAGLSFADAMRANLPGIGVEHQAVAAFAGFDASAWLSKRGSRGWLWARHTVGLGDPLTDADVQERLDDGLPQTLAEVVARYGHRHFKLKIGGDVQADLARLRAIAAVLDGIPQPWWATLDGNEQYTDVAALRELVERVQADPALRRLADAILFIEQPLPRALALDTDVAAIASPWPLLIDESDGTLDAFVQARARGWRGVSSKTCKGLYKSVLNALRCDAWNAQEGVAGRFFLSGEDLTLQAGIALQQDLLLADLLGLDHVERNGHHYVDGLRARPEGDQAALATAHPDLYDVQPHPGGGAVTRLRIHQGRMDFASLARCGYGSDVSPDFGAMVDMPRPADVRPSPAIQDHAFPPDLPLALGHHSPGR
jgi:hypothetical protein